MTAKNEDFDCPFCSTDTYPKAYSLDAGDKFDCPSCGGHLRVFMGDDWVEGMDDAIYYNYVDTP